MRARKGNKSYIVDEATKAQYLKAGFDIFSDEGELLESGKGKTVSYEQYLAVKKALDEAEQNAGGEDDSLVLAVLQAYAAEHNIDTGRASTASGIAKKIKEAKPDISEG